MLSNGYLPDTGDAQAGITAFADVFISKSMLRVATSDSQLASVLSHEIAHLLARHNQEIFEMETCIQRWRIPFTPIMVPGVILTKIGESMGGGVLAAPGSWMNWPIEGPNTYRLHRRRHHEFEADEIALYLTAAAGYDIDAGPLILGVLGDFELKAIARMKQKDVKAIKQSSSHPPVSIRSSHIPTRGTTDIRAVTRFRSALRECEN